MNQSLKFRSASAKLTVSIEIASLCAFYVASDSVSFRINFVHYIHNILILLYAKMHGHVLNENAQVLFI